MPPDPDQVKDAAYKLGTAIIAMTISHSRSLEDSKLEDAVLAIATLALDLPIDRVPTQQDP